MRPISQSFEPDDHAGRGATERCVKWLAALFLVASWGVLAPSVAAQEAVGRITGVVTEASSGAPLTDVQVFLEGAQLGSLTRPNGRYIILNVRPGAYEIRAVHIGHARATQQITVTAGVTLELNFALETQALGLDEIVVTGAAGAARRREIGNTISQISVPDLPEKPQTVSDILRSTTTGIEVVSAGGETGQGSAIRLRGSNSVNMGSQPIIYIDGIRMMEGGFPLANSPDSRTGRGANNVPTPLDALNSNDIERVEVIKGSAATTLYGTEASAGVIQIFTKRGTAGRPTWSAEIQEQTMWTPFLGVNGVDHLNLDPFTCTGPFECGEYMEHTPWVQDYSTSVRGGAQSLQYFLSGQLNEERGNLPLDAMTKWNARGNFTFAPVEDLLIQFNSAYTNQHLKNTPSGNNGEGLALNVFYGDANYFGDKKPETIAQLLVWDIQQNIDRFTTGGTMTYSPLPNLTNRFTVGFDFSLQETRSIRPFGYYFRPLGGVDSQTFQNRLMTFDYVGTFGFDVMSGIRSTFSWGGQSVGNEVRRLEGWGEGFPGAAVPTVSSAASTVGYESREKNWNAGFFLQNVFDLWNRYFVTLGMRVDGNSAFGKGFGLQVYPKLSGTWVISDESFWVSSLGQLKLRTAFGQSGRAPGSFDAVRTWTNTGLAGIPAFVPQNVGNPDLGPEVTAELEAGADAAWLDDRIKASFTYYRQITSDALLNATQIPSLGFTNSQLSNIGKVENKGTELSLELSPIRSANWGWDLGVNHSTNHNKILEWPGDTARVGKPTSYTTWTDVRNPHAIGTPVNCSTIADANGNVDPSKPCLESSTLTKGWPQLLPPTIISGSTSVRMPYGVMFSLRGEYRGGNYGTRNNFSITRSVRSPACLPYYANETGVVLKPGVEGIWVARCSPGINQGYTMKSDYFKLRSVTLSVPVDFVFPDMISNPMFTMTLGNSYTWARERLFGAAYGVETLANGGANLETLNGSDRLPPPVTFRASLSLTF